MSDLAIWDAGPPPPAPARFNIARYALGQGPEDRVALEIIAHPDAPPERWRVGALGAAIGGTMTGLAARGVAPGDRVLLSVGHSVDFPILFLAAAGMGAVPIPLSTQLTAGEVARISALAGARLRIGSPALPGEAVDLPTARGWRELAPAPFADTCADAPAYMVFTSGTGGAPKGVLHAHRAAWARRMMWADWYGLKPGDRVLHAGAFNWTFTLGTGLIDPWAAGATALIYTGPGDRRVWSEIARRHGPTHFAAVPGIFRQILDADTAKGEAFATVRSALTAGEALPPGLAARWQAATGRPLLSALGMSEVSTYVSDRPDGQRALAQHGRRIAILDDATDRPVTRGVAGRLAVSARDPGLMLGYWRGDGPVLPLSGDWFLTGDRAIMAADGSVTWVGRSDSLLNAQGYRVAPEEVEAVLLSHPSVADALVVDLPVRADLTILAAFVTPTEDVPVAELKSHCAQHLAAYKCPREIRFRSALPRNARGKRDRKALVQTEGWSPP